MTTKQTKTSTPKGFFILDSLICKIPFEVYKDKIAVLDRLNRINNKGIAFYHIIYDDYSAYLSAHNPTFILYNLEPEDFTHLNLLGIPLNPKKPNCYPHLANALANKHKIIRRNLCYI